MGSKENAILEFYQQFACVVCRWGLTYQIKGLLYSPSSPSETRLNSLTIKDPSVDFTPFELTAADDIAIAAPISILYTRLSVCDEIDSPFSPLLVRLP